MYCVGISGDDPENFTMEIPLLILPSLNVDFDGDLIKLLLSNIMNNNNLNCLVGLKKSA